MMFLRVKICSQHDRSFLNPACSSLSCESMHSCSLFNIIELRIFLGTDNKVIPRQFLGTDNKGIPRQFPHFDRSPFLGSLAVIPFLHSSGTSSNV